MSVQSLSGFLREQYNRFPCKDILYGAFFVGAALTLSNRFNIIELDYNVAKVFTITIFSIALLKICFVKKNLPTLPSRIFLPIKNKETTDDKAKKILKLFSDWPGKVTVEALRKHQSDQLTKDSIDQLKKDSADKLTNHSVPKRRQSQEVTKLLTFPTSNELDIDKVIREDELNELRKPILDHIELESSEYICEMNDEVSRLQSMYINTYKKLECERLMWYFEDSEISEDAKKMRESVSEICSTINFAVIFDALNDFTQSSGVLKILRKSQLIITST